MDGFDNYKRPSKVLKFSQTDMEEKKCTTGRGNLEVLASAFGQSKDPSQQTLNFTIKEEKQDEDPQEIIYVTPQMEVSPTGDGPSLLIDFKCILDETRRRALRGLFSVHPCAFDGIRHLRTPDAQAVGFCYLSNILVGLRSLTPNSSPAVFDNFKAHAADLEALGLQGGWLLEHVAALERTAAAMEAVRVYEAKKQACEELKKKVAERETELANEKKKIAELEAELADKPVVPRPPAPFPY